MLNIIVCVFAPLIRTFTIISSMLTSFNILRIPSTLTMDIGEGSLDIVPFDASGGVQTWF